MKSLDSDKKGENIRVDYYKIFPEEKRRFWHETVETLEQIREIRIRVNKPVLLYRQQKEYSLNEEGKVILNLTEGKKFSYEEIQELINYWCQDSRYAFQEELKKGFLTIEGGHRVGVCGEIVKNEKGTIQMIKYISGLNIRIAHEIKYVGKNIIGYLYSQNELHNTLIIAPPGAGKTTMLRDLIRRISDGNLYGKGQTVGIVDERSEIAACFQGIPQLEVGKRTDVLDNCPKAEGMMMLLRSMSPQVIAVDELGSEQDVEVLQKMAGCGCSILATIHGGCLEEVQKKVMFQSLWEQKLFQRFLILQHDIQGYHSSVYKEGEEQPCFVC